MRGTNRRGLEWFLCSLAMIVAVVALPGCPPTPPNGNTNVNDNGNANDNGNTNVNNNSTDPVCGNGAVEAGEQCDPPDGTSCDDACQTIPVGGAVCGNSLVEEGEQCDPPDQQTCDDACQTIEPMAECGNGIIEAGEECDGGSNCTACVCDDGFDPTSPTSVDCQVSLCSNQAVDAGEECDGGANCTDCSCDNGFGSTTPVSIDCEKLCGNGVVDQGERCDPPDDVTCDANCQTITVAGPECGNSEVESGETCDPPNGDTCDANCQITTGGGLANDSCENPIAATDGTRSYTNVGATTDGPPACNLFGNPQIDSDIWFCYTATCDELVTVSLCGSLYDTKLAVYTGCACPTVDDNSIACSDDDCGAGQESRATFLAVTGQDYMIRTGGFLGNNNEEGEGTLSIFCEGDPDHGLNTCRATSGDCFSANGSPGCNNVDVCTKTCAADPYCCDAEWDALCAQKADGIGNGFDSCGAGNGSCFLPDGTAGCEDSDCCQSVCEVDPFCCLTEWDQVCADAVPERCGIFEACLGARGECFGQHAAPGCNVATCCTDVCNIDPTCCTAEWDATCVDFANQNCAP